jgi:hypothetical protein
MLKENSIIPKPSYRFKIDGVSFSAEFDTSMHETKKGIRITFSPVEGQMDVRKLNDYANKIAVVLQKQFANYNIQIDRDTQAQDPTVIRFVIPLVSITNFIINKVIKGQ